MFIFTMVFLFGNTVYSQCKNTESEQIGINYSKKIVKDCNSSPDELTISIDSCSNGKVWTTITWKGDVSTVNYKMKLYIEFDKEIVTVFYKDYDKFLIERGMSILTVGCIDLSKTKEIKCGNSIKFYPYKEFKFDSPLTK